MQHLIQSPPRRQLGAPTEEPKPIDRVLADVARRTRAGDASTLPENVATTLPPIHVETSRRPDRKEPEAYTVQAGRIVTQVWAQRTSWDGIIWRISQHRTHSHAIGGGNYRSFHFGDLNDAVRGLYRAQRWIRREERKRQRRWWMW